MMNNPNKEEVWYWIKKQDWTPHIKAGARSQWRRKHEPDLIQRVPNRGIRYENPKKEERKEENMENQNNLQLGFYSQIGDNWYEYIRDEHGIPPQPFCVVWCIYKSVVQVFKFFSNYLR